MLDKIRYKAYRFKYNNAPHLPLSKPVDIALELSSACNQKCVYCYHADKENLPFKQRFMNTEFAKALLMDAYVNGVHSLKFNYRGESTLHPQFYEITTYAKCLANESTFIDRVTNSNFNFKLDAEDIFQGLCNQTKVKVSFDSFRKDIIEKVRVGTNYGLALSNITKFYNYPGRKTKLVVQAVRTLANKDEDLEYEIKKRWPEAGVSVRDMVADRVNADLQALEYRKRDYSERQSCIQAHARMIVHWDGKVVPCCPSIDDSLVIGDLTKQSLLEVWNSDKAKALRKELKSGEAFQFKPCQNCSSFETFKGYKAPKDS